MKLEGTDRLIGVATCDDKNDVLLPRARASASGSKSATSVFATLVRRRARHQLADGDEVISMSILKHVEFDTEAATPT